MKATPSPLALPLTFAFAFALLGSSPALLAQEEHEERPEPPHPGQEETLRFLGETVPQALEVLTLVEKHEGEAEREAVLERFQEVYHEYRLIRFHDGEEIAESFLAGKRLGLAFDVAVHEYFETDNPPKREEIKEQLRTLLRRQLAQRLQATRLELGLLDERRAELEAEIRELSELGEEEIEAELHALLHGEEEEEE
ncbi:MAG: hypothetical protein AAF555_07050 [Verrucomicrobiota bacterium]